MNTSLPLTLSPILAYELPIMPYESPYQSTNSSFIPPWGEASSSSKPQETPTLTSTQSFVAPINDTGSSMHLNVNVNADNQFSELVELFPDIQVSQL